MLIFLIFFIPLIQTQTLLLSIEYARHGARNTSKKGYQLTSAGMRQHYILGKMLRKRYIEDNKLLSERYCPDEILVNSSDSYRTIMSAQAQLAGLYGENKGNLLNAQHHEKAIPPNEYDYTKWKEMLGLNTLIYGYADIPVYGVRDNVLTPSELCKGVTAMVKKYNEDNKNEKEEGGKKFKQVYKEVAEAFNMREEDVNLSSVLGLRDTLISNLWEGDPVKNEEVSKKLIKDTEEVDKYLSYKYFFEVKYGDRIVHRIIASGFLNTAKDLISQKVNATLNRVNMPLKFVLFSGHDTMLNAILMNLDINHSDILVPFASAVFIELYQNKNNSFTVKVIFNEMDERVYALDNFYKLIEDNAYDPVKAYEYCNNFTFKLEGEEKEDTPIVVYLIGNFCTLAIIASITVSIIYCMRRKNNYSTLEDPIYDTA